MLTILDHFGPFQTILDHFQLFFFSFFWNFLIQNFSVVLTPADLWYHAWFQRYCHVTLFVTVEQEQQEQQELGMLGVRFGWSKLSACVNNFQIQIIDDLFRPYEISRSNGKYAKILRITASVFCVIFAIITIIMSIHWVHIEYGHHQSWTFILGLLQFMPRCTHIIIIVDISITETFISINILIN